MGTMNIRSLHVVIVGALDFTLVSNFGSTINRSSKMIDRALRTSINNDVPKMPSIASVASSAGNVATALNPNTVPIVHPVAASSPVAGNSADTIDSKHTTTTTTANNDDAFVKNQTTAQNTLSLFLRVKEQTAIAKRAKEDNAEAVATAKQAESTSTMAAEVDANTPSSSLQKIEQPVIVDKGKEENAEPRDSLSLVIPNKIGNNETSALKQTVALFLNIWIPPEDLYVGKDYERSKKVSLEIVAKQLKQISQSCAATQDLTVYMTVVGKYAVDQKGLGNLCQSVSIDLTCVFSGYIQGGGELDTLSTMHDFCGNTPSGDDTTKAIYLYNKGSFHPDQKNDCLRRAMTDASTTDLCLKTQDGNSNACGLQYTAPPIMFTTLFPEKKLRRRANISIRYCTRKNTTNA